MKRDKVRQSLLDRCAGKDVLMLGPLGTYDCYRRGMYQWWDFHYLKGTAKSLVGIDINRSLVDTAQLDGYNVLYGDAEDFAGDYDVIYAPDLIEHLGNPLRCLQCCARSLRPGGVVIMETPNPIRVDTLLKALLTGNKVSYPEHTCWIAADNAQELARRAGFAVKVIAYSPLNPYGLAMRIRTAIYRAIARVRPGLGGKLVFLFTIPASGGNAG